jgi:predicted nuclease with TOPRIM domain
MTDQRTQPDPVEPHDRPELWSPRLRRILDEQIQAYEELLGLAESQAALIDEDRSDELISLLASRQTIVERATRIGQRLEPFTSRWDDLSPRLEPGQRREIAERTSRLDGLLERIAALDDADRRRLEKRRDEVGRDIHALASKRSAVAAYGGAARPQPAPRYQDRQG